MVSKTWHISQLGRMLLAADEESLIGAWFEGQRFFAAGLTDEAIWEENEILQKAKNWLDIYFSGRKTEFDVPVHLTGTDFQKAVWEKLKQIPYAETVTYGELAKELAIDRGVAKLSPQAVGNAVAHNPISIIVPCHRVVGRNNKLIGYAGGIDKKAFLLELERNEVYDRKDFMALRQEATKTAFMICH